MRATTARLARLTPSSSHPPANKSNKSNIKNQSAAATKKKTKNVQDTDHNKITTPPVKRAYNKKSNIDKKATKIASLIKEKKLITIKNKTKKLPKVIKPKIVKIKPVKRLVKAKSNVQQESTSSTSTTSAADEITIKEPAVKVTKKTKAVERQASPKRGKSQSPARAAKSTPPVVTTTKQQKVKKNVSLPITRKKKVVNTTPKSNKPNPTGLKRGRKLGSVNMPKEQPQQPTEVVEATKKTIAAKKKRASSQDSISGNTTEIPVIPASPPPVVVAKTVKKTKEKAAPKNKDPPAVAAATITSTTAKKIPKKVVVAKKPKITQQEKSDYEKGVEEIEVNESLIKLDDPDNEKKLKPCIKLTTAGIKKKKLEIKKIEEEEEEARKIKALIKEKKEKLARKPMVPPKKRAMVPLKKRLVASAALEMDFKPSTVIPLALVPVSSPVRAPEVVKKEEYSSSDDATLDVVLHKFLQQRQQQQLPVTKPSSTKKVPATKTGPKRKNTIKKKVAKPEYSSSAPSSPEPVTKKTKKIVKRSSKSAAAKKNSKIKALVAMKKRNLQVDKIRKKIRTKNMKKSKKHYSTSGSESEHRARHTQSSDEERSNRMKIFGFWSAPKKHRVASLNAIAKVHCLYENEARHTPAMFLAATAGKSGTAVTTTTTTTTNISTRTLRSGPARGAGHHWYDSNSSSDSSSGPDSPPSGVMVPYRRRRNSSGDTAPATKKKTAASKPPPPPPTPPTPPTPVRKVRKKRCDMIMDLKDMVVRKRMASLNASAILAASYSFEKRTPNKSSCTTSSVQFKVVKVQQQSTTTSIQNHVVATEVESSDLDSTPTSPNLQSDTSPETIRINKKPATVTSKRTSTGNKRGRPANKEPKVPPKKRKRHVTGDSDINVADEEDEDDEEDDPLAKVIRVRAPKKVALIMNDTDVTITGVYVNTRSTEGYCISGMEYRISSTSHTQTEATTVLQRGPHQSGPQPPPPPQQSPEHISRHHHLHHHHHHHDPVQPVPEHPGFRGAGECDPTFAKPQPPQSYTPLGALSSMQPPASLQTHGVPVTNTQQLIQPPQPPPLRVHHGGPSPLGRHGSSAFSAPPSAYGGPPPSADATSYLHGYYQPAGPLIHAGGSELCRASSKLGGAPSAPPLQPQGPTTLLLAPPPNSVQEQQHSETRSEASTSASPLPPPPQTHIVSSQGSPFRHYTPYPSYAPQYHHAPPQYYHPHPAPQSALVAASHHLAPPPSQELCYSSCYSPHYKYPPSPYRRYPHQHFYPAPPSHQADVYSLPGPSTSSSSFQPPAPPPSSSSVPVSQHQHQQEAGSSSAPPQGAYPPPPTLSQQPPEPPPAYQFYPGYSPGPGACYSHAPPPRGVAFLDASYQSCPCPMQSCPKNVHTGPLTGDSKGPGPQETLFVMPPVAAAAAAHPTSASRGPLPPGHPPSPARGSSGGPPVAQGPSPPATAADQSRNQQSPEAWVTAEPTPPPSDDSSAPRGDTDLCDSVESTTDVNQNYHGNSKKRRLSISARLDTKKMKTMSAETQFPPLDSNNAFSAINEPLLITTTMLQSNKKLEDSVILRENYDIKNNNVEMPILPPTPPTSADTSPPLKPKSEKQAKIKVIRSKPSKLKAANPPSPTKRKQQRPSKRNNSCMLKSHGMRDSPQQTSPSPPVPVETTNNEVESPTEKEVKAKINKHCFTSLINPVNNNTTNMTNMSPKSTTVNALMISTEYNNLTNGTPSTNSIIISSSVLPSLSNVSKPQASLPKTKLALSNTTPKCRKNKLVPSATDVTSLPGNIVKVLEVEPSVEEQLDMRPPAPIKKGGKRKSSPSLAGTIKKSKKQLQAEALAAAREAEENAQNDLLKKAILRKTLTPKWSNGWSWEGEPFQAKVFLRNDDAPVLRHCYPAMRHEEGDVVVARDCVLLKSGTRKGDLPYVAKVSALWENPDDGEMMVSLLWYYRPEHTDKGRKPEDMPDEIFASKHKDNSSVACIEDKCYVLTFNEYCRYRGTVRQLEEGAMPRPLVVPKLPAGLGCGRENRMPSNRVSPDLVLFCRKVYDFRQKRMLKNPG